VGTLQSFIIIGPALNSALVLHYKRKETLKNAGLLETGRVKVVSESPYPSSYDILSEM